MNADITIQINPSFVLGHGMMLRVTPGYQDELVEIINAEGGHASLVIQASAGQDLVPLAVQLLENTPFDVLLASVLRLFLRRNHGKTVKFNDDERIKEASGYSAAQIDKLARDAAKRQADLERQQPDAGFPDE